MMRESLKLLQSDFVGVSLSVRVGEAFASAKASARAERESGGTIIIISIDIRAKLR